MAHKSILSRIKGSSTNDFRQVTVRGHQQTIFVTVNGIGPLGGEGVQLKSVKNVAFVTKIEISPNVTSIFKD